MGCIPATFYQEPDVDPEVPALRVVKRNYCNLTDLVVSHGFPAFGSFAHQSSGLFCGLSMLLVEN